MLLCLSKTCIILSANTRSAQGRCDYQLITTGANSLAVVYRATLSNKDHLKLATDMTTDRYLRCCHLAYGAAAVSLLTIHLSFLVSVSQGYIDGCSPYWSDCSSISRSGRHGLAYFIFKGGMLPAALLLGLFWQLNRLWLGSLAADSAAGRYLPAVGWTASLALLIYTLALGHSGDTFYLLRRFGVVTFLGLSLIAFALLAGALRRSPLKWHGSLLGRGSAAILGLALISLVLDALLGDDYEQLENAFEWWLVLLLLVQLLWVARLWQLTAFTLTPHSRPRS